MEEEDIDQDKQDDQQILIAKQPSLKGQDRDQLMGETNNNKNQRWMGAEQYPKVGSKKLAQEIVDLCQATDAGNLYGSSAEKQKGKGPDLTISSSRKRWDRQDQSQSGQINKSDISSIKKQNRDRDHNEYSNFEDTLNHQEQEVSGQKQLID